MTSRRNGSESRMDFGFIFIHRPRLFLFNELGKLRAENFLLDNLQRTFKCLVYK